MENLTDTLGGKNATADTLEDLAGICLASSFLFFGAIIAIYVGSLRSLKRHQKGYGTEEEFLTEKDAMQFPIYASIALFSIYIIFKFIPKYILNNIVLVFFTFSAVISLTRLVIPIIRPYIPKLIANHHFKLTFLETSDPEDENVKEPLNEELTFEFQRVDFPAILGCTAIGLAYAYTKHWVANNVFGLAFSITALECLHLNKFKNGFILLGGLFFYDIFWVFGTDVMVSVAKNFDAPIKIVFPKNFLDEGIFADKQSMLGLGDIVIPGVFVAMLLRFDQKLNRNNRFYFFVGYLSYIFGLLMTFVVMLYFKHAQPALLYLSPSCTGIPALVALIRGDFKAMLDYEDASEEQIKALKKLPSNGKLTAPTSDSVTASKPATRSTLKKTD